MRRACDRDPHWKEAFLHPKQALGIVVQLAESSRGGTPPRMRLPPGPPNPPPPVTLLGLRLRARARQRARVQWESVLEGAGQEAPDGTLIYRWGYSPLRLAVEISPGEDEGPVCVEFAAERPVALAEGPHPVLGAVFVRREQP